VDGRNHLKIGKGEKMEYLIVLNVIVLSVMIGLLVTDVESKYIKDNLDIQNPENSVATINKCPQCGVDIERDASRCIKCGVIFMFYKSKLSR
jgi:hypothetical protein